MLSVKDGNFIVKVMNNYHMKDLIKIRILIPYVK